MHLSDKKRLSCDLKYIYHLEFHSVKYISNKNNCEMLSFIKYFFKKSRNFNDYQAIKIKRRHVRN